MHCQLQPGGEHAELCERGADEAGQKGRKHPATQGLPQHTRPQESANKEVQCCVQSQEKQYS